MNSLIILSVLLVLFSFWSVSHSLTDECPKASVAMRCVEDRWASIPKTDQSACCSDHDKQCTQIIEVRANCPEVYSKQENWFKNMMETIKTLSCEKKNVSPLESACNPILPQNDPKDCGKHSFCADPQFGGCSLHSTSKALALTLSLITSFVLFCIR